jgi:hypothetical protein
MDIPSFTCNQSNSHSHAFSPAPTFPFSKQSMSTEIEIMKRIRHRHIVSMYELYETPKCLWIILELVNR